MNSRLKILQLCSYYTGSKVHSNLFLHLDKHFEQDIFVPLRNADLAGRNNFKFNNSKVHYTKIWSIYHRFYYKRKIRLAGEFIENHGLHKNIDLVHAHTWFSDGGTAYQLNAKYNTPYVITIRNTDINIFFKYFLHIRKFGYRILLKSSAIVFISPAYLAKLLDVVPSEIKEAIQERAFIIPNAVDDFWLDNRKIIINKNPINEKIELIYAGSIIPLKNIKLLIQGFIKASLIHNNLNLTLVGFSGESTYENKIKKQYGKWRNIHLVDKQSKPEELLKYYRKADVFIMPSKKETFGLVYIEALSQGLPIIYSQGQGVDGYFEGMKIGISVNSSKKEEIANAISEMVKNYQEYKPKELSFLDRFSWNKVSNQYFKLYSSINERIT